jgi:hypothetical protein
MKVMRLGWQIDCQLFAGADWVGVRLGLKCELQTARGRRARFCPLLRLVVLSDPDRLVVIGRIIFGVIGAPGCRAVGTPKVAT